MSEKKYHVSRNGFLTKCTATKRACSRGGAHFNQEQYNTMATENDSRIRGKSTKPSPNSYYGKAEAAYVASVKRLARYDKVQAETKAFKKKLLKSSGLKSADLLNSQEQVRATLEKTLNHAKEVYVEEGVNYGKASFIIQDMKNSSEPTKPILKRKDRLDDQLAAKTKAAVTRLNEDPKYSTLVSEYDEAKRKAQLAGDINRKVSQFQTETMRARNANAMPNFNEQKEYVRAKTWLKAGISPEASERPTSTITPEQVSIDNNGRINNAWIEKKDGTVEKIVAYRDRNSGGFGALVTESGTDVFTTTHYHSYKAEHKGINKVILGKVNGSTYPAKKFSLHESWDSGG